MGEVKAYAITLLIFLFGAVNLLYFTTTTSTSYSLDANSTSLQTLVNATTVNATFYEGKIEESYSENSGQQVNLFNFGFTLVNGAIQSVNLFYNLLTAFPQIVARLIIETNIPIVPAAIAIIMLILGILIITAILSVIAGRNL